MTSDDASSKLTLEHFHVPCLGPAQYDNPLSVGHRDGCPGFKFADDIVRIRYDVTIGGDAQDPPLSFEKAGLRRRTFFRPEDVRAAVVTCGGLSPGLNDVIRSLVTELRFQYRVDSIRGIRYGYQGLNPAYGWPMVDLTLDRVSDIHTEGGTILGSSRERQPAATMVDTLQQQGINMLFCVGGDGTQRGALDICREAARRLLPLSVVGIPKTIDNDIAFVYKTFGFDTAVAFATEALTGAHTEAKDYPRGVGMVKLMGRDSGFIAAYATLASGDVNFLLVPEIPFGLDGENGFLAHLGRRLDRRGHALIAVAEGAGQELFGEGTPRRAESDNARHQDIGLLLKNRIAEHFQARKEPVSMKYIDPGYMIRSMPANASDGIFCQDLARNAVHAAMAGKTGVMIGLWHNVFVHVPIALAVTARKKILPTSSLWLSVLEMTGQPARMV